MIRKIIADGKAEKDFLKEVERRNGENDKKVSEIVSEIIENVRENGDKAVKEYTLCLTFGNAPKNTLLKNFVCLQKILIILFIIIQLTV